MERAPCFEQLDSVRMESEYNILWVSQEPTGAEVSNQSSVPYVRQDACFGILLGASCRVLCEDLGAPGRAKL